MSEHAVVKTPPFQKYAGILAHPTSFPGPYGIGDLGPGAYHFIDFLEKSGMNLWQVLPIGHTGFGDSPYQPFSSFAGQPLIISIDHLRELGLLWDSDFYDMPAWNPVDADYGTVIEFKTRLFKLAYERFLDPAIEDALSTKKEHQEEYAAFLEENTWLSDYSLFMAGKDYHNGMPWYMWEDNLKNPTAKQKEAWTAKLEKEIGYYNFLQFLFHRDWLALKEYANEKGIKIVGDIPIFVAWDSVDVWCNKSLFKLDSKGYPTVVSGVPPDYFSETGQRWGNPLYKWANHKRTGYQWWIDRLKHQLKLADFIRIDHFRGFDEYWSIPYDEETAINGKWEKAPGVHFFTALEEALGTNMPIIAEDLGEITPSVTALREQFGLPGMKILQFAFENTQENAFLPHNYTRNCVCYTGTHDNDTSIGWYHHTSEAAKDKFRRYYSTDGSNPNWTLIRGCFSSVANMAIVPMQDVLGLDSWARMNKPGVGEGNWSWRFTENELRDDIAARLHEIAELFGRLETPCEE